MSLAHDAANDFREIMNDDLGATWECNVISPAGVSEPLLCRMSDIHQQVNPGTNEVVTGRQLSVSICLQDLDTVGFGDIRGIERNDLKPWKIETDNILGQSGTYRVVESNPDASLGNVILWLEAIA